MMGPKKKGGMALVLDLGKPKGGDEGDDSEETSDEEMSSSAKREAAQALLDAIQAKDVAGIDDALSTHYDLCASKSGSEEGE